MPSESWSSASEDEDSDPMSKNPRQSAVLQKAYTEKFTPIARLVADCNPLEFGQIKHTFGVPEKLAPGVEPKFEDYFPKA